MTAAAAGATIGGDGTSGSGLSEKDAVEADGVLMRC